MCARMGPSLRFMERESRVRAADEPRAGWRALSTLTTMPLLLSLSLSRSVAPFTRYLRGGCARASRSLRVLALAPALAGVFALAGCTPHIGDKCVLSTDCSVQGTLVCDTSQPGGYCTELNCARGSCPSNALCVVFQANVPGCAYDDYQSPARTGRSFCMENCSQASDCRAGYVCADPTAAPWMGAILDDNQSQGVCIAPVPGGLPEAGARVDAAICQPYDEDAASGDDGSLATSATDAAPDAGADAGADASLDGGSGEGGDAGPGAPADARAADAPADAPAADASADASAGG